MASIITRKKNKPAYSFRNKWSKGTLGVTLVLWFIGIVFSLTDVRAEVVIPTPSWVEKKAVGDKMIINGLPSTVHYFKSDKSLEELLRFYRQRWDSGDKKRPGYREVEFAPWHIISRLEDDKRYLLTVQARSEGPLTADGYLAVADLKGLQKDAATGSGIPKMKGSRVVNDLTSFDPGKKARTVLVVNDFSVSSNTEFYRNYYSSRGWVKSMDIEKDGGQVLVFSRFGEEVQIVINRNFSTTTQVVMNIVGQG